MISSRSPILRGDSAPGRPRTPIEGSRVGVSLEDMERRARDFYDGVRTATTCALCGWRFEGTAAEGRSAARGHRREAHPHLPEPRRWQGRRWTKRVRWTREACVDALVVFRAEHGRLPRSGELRAPLPSIETLQKFGGVEGLRDEVELAIARDEGGGE